MNGGVWMERSEWRGVAWHDVACVGWDVTRCGYYAVWWTGGGGAKVRRCQVQECSHKTESFLHVIHQIILLHDIVRTEGNDLSWYDAVYAVVRCGLC